MKKKHWILFIIIAGIFLIGMPVYFFKTLPGKGDIAPSIKLKDLSEKEFSIEEYRGKILFVHFWATWCSLCRHELPLVEKLRKKFQEKGLAVISILEDEESSDKLINDIRKIAPITFPVLLDNNGIAADAYGVYGVPESFIIGRDGVILKRFSGAVDWDASYYTSYFEELLKE